MKIYKFLLMFFLAGSLVTSCAKDDIDDKGTDLPGEEPQGENVELEIKDFEWKGMNYIYLYKDNVPELQDNYFSTQEELNTWLKDWSSPEDLFYDGLVYKYEEVDEFSWIVDNYEDLENTFAGISKSTGMDYGLSLYCDTCSEVFGYVRYVLPNSPADQQGIKRGMIFTKIDGQQITNTNYSQLLASETLSFEFATIEGNSLVPNGDTKMVTKTTITENPVLIAKTIDLEGTKVGYLMYNSFTHGFDDELNDAFGQFKADGVTELVLDLRYNGGGRVDLAIDLASMITGQFEGDVFIKTKYNNGIQSQFDPEDLVDRFDSQIYSNDSDHDEHQPTAINSLNLDKVYIIGTGSTASASELVINGLAPYIDVVHVGTNTVGKFQASVTVYDSPGLFDKEDINQDHTYAMQPLILKSTNANGDAYSQDGLVPDIEQREYIDTYGTLGDPSEPLLAAALNDIKSNRSLIEASKKGELPIHLIGESKEDNPAFQRMYIEKLPKLPNTLKRFEFGKE